MSMKNIICLAFLALYAGASAQVEFKAFGADATGIQGTVDAYRTAMGALNPNQAGIQNPAGRREINWDGVPDQFASPNDLPTNFFNANSPRGAVFSGANSFRVSADDSNPTNTPVRFGDFFGDYPGIFSTFSSQRLFSAIGSTSYEVNFFVAGSNEAGLTRGFGAVFTDVDLDDLTKIEYFDKQGALLLTTTALASGDVNKNGTLSFAGALFEDPIVARVRIHTGNVLLGGTEGRTEDVVVADDFIYGEVVPEPASMTALALGIAALVRRRKKA